MPIEPTCTCGQRLQMPDELAGQQGHCPACGASVQIPQRAAGKTPSDEEAVKTLLADLGLPEPQARSVPTAPDNRKLTRTGCVVTLLSVAAIVAVALPIVRWRDPATGEPLPRMVAVLTPVLIGAVFHGICSVLLRLVGLRTWAKSHADESRPPHT
jgi:hypothetical protein